MPNRDLLTALQDLCHYTGSHYARMAEQAGFTFAMISDHFNPWVSQQGNASFAWSVIGGISQVTSKLRLGTGVTCPTFRYHPAIVAQAAATAAAMLPGRFILGLGSGEKREILPEFR